MTNNKNKMYEITKEEAIENNLKFMGSFVGTNLSQTVLMMERYSENPYIKYYIMEYLAVDEESHDGLIKVSFWCEGIYTKLNN